MGKSLESSGWDWKWISEDVRVQTGRFSPCFSDLSTMLGGLGGINIYWGVLPYVIILIGRKQIKE